MKRKYIAPLASLAVTGGLLLAAVFAMLSSSLGWFAKNDTVSASGISVSARGVPNTEEYLLSDGVRLDGNTNDVFSLMTPGDVRTVQLYVHNLSEQSVDLTVIMSAPTAESDTVYVENGLYHYFGTQIRLNSVKKDGTDILPLTGANKYLLPLADTLYTNGLQPTGLDSEYDFTSTSDKQISSIITLAPDEELTLSLEFEFVDNGEVQNAYISFADNASADATKAALNLSRTLICYYAFADE